MGSTIYSSMTYVSEFTLALMQDSGWYSVDYNFAEPYFWGKNEGCDWFVTDCVNKTTQLSNFPQYFCRSTADNGCNHDYTGVGYCLFYTSTDNIPTQYQYYVCQKTLLFFSFLFCFVIVSRCFSNI